MVKTNKILLLLLLFIGSSFLGMRSFGQGEIEKRRLPDNYNENTYGVKLNSTGYGLDYRFSQRVTHRLRRYYEVEYNIINSTKEVKVVNPRSDPYSLRRFVFGKTHFVNNIKLGMGFDRMFFEKRDKNSISVHLFASAGGALAISKPIYYEIVDSVDNIDNMIIYHTSYRQVNVDMQHNSTDILSRAPFIYGLDEMILHPGIFVKGGIAFDFSREPLKTNVLEVGASFDYYFKPFEIMAGHQHSSLFSLYISYRFGRKYDATLHREARRWERQQMRADR